MADTDANMEKSSAKNNANISYAVWFNYKYRIDKRVPYEFLYKCFNAFGEVEKLIVHSTCEKDQFCVYVHYKSKDDAVRVKNDPDMIKKFGIIEIEEELRNYNLSIENNDDSGERQDYKLIISNLTEDEIINEVLDRNDAYKVHSVHHIDEIALVIILTWDEEVYKKYLDLNKSLLNGRKVLIEDFDNLIRFGVLLAHDKLDASRDDEDKDYTIKSNLSAFRAKYPLSYKNMSIALNGEDMDTD